MARLMLRRSDDFENPGNNNVDHNLKSAKVQKVVVHQKSASKC